MSPKQSWEETPSCRQCDKLEREIAELKQKLAQANFDQVEGCMMSTNGKHITWRSQHTAGHDTHGQTAVYDESDGKTVAIVYDGDAHASLISAAPTMYEALKALTHLCGEMGYYPLNVEQAERALARAEGRV
jgi:hypothetical protein